MEDKNLAIIAGIFILSTAVGFSTGHFTTGNSPAPDEYDEEVDFTANSSNPVEKASFDDRNISLIVQPAKNASFFLEIRDKVNKLEALAHDGDVHELRKIKAISGKTYLFYFRYSDDPNTTGDEWLTLYRIREL